MMNKKILLLALMICTGDSVKAALSGIDPEVAQILAGAADQVNQAVERATHAEQQLAQHKQEAQEALERAAQFSADAARFRSDNDALLASAAEQEAKLDMAMERADLQVATIAKLRKEKVEMGEQADVFLRKLQELTQEHEAVVAGQREARNALEQVRKEKEQNDGEVQRLQAEMASLSSFGVQRGGMPFAMPREHAQLNMMAVLNPSYVDKEQVEKDAVKKKLVTALGEAIAGQKKMQDVVDEACALVEEKDKEIATLTMQAITLEVERIKLEEQQKESAAFKDASRAGYDYLDTEDVTEAQVGAAVASAQPVMPPRRNETLLDSLLMKLREILDAAQRIR